jgi:excinuclease ABC subunit C
MEGSAAINEDRLKDVVSALPEEPGIYRYYNKDNVLIYVGKAKNLKKRVSSYFLKSIGLSRKTRKLVSEIDRIEYTVANSEFDALLLENNFIKENQPKYNILLKDDKTFPYLCILKERFPRIIYTRKYIPSQGEYFGPFSSVVAMKNVLDLVRKLYTIRTCNLLLTEQNIREGKFKVCLEYHIGNCLGPCEGFQEETSYLEDIQQARHILRGNLSIVQQYFTTQMRKASEELAFEKAHQFKEKLETLDRFQSKSLVVSQDNTDLDVFTITSDDVYAYVNYLQIKEGAIIFSKTVEIKKKLEESDEDILIFIILELREQAQSQHTTIVSNQEVNLDDAGLTVIVPKIGDKKKLVALSIKNALELKKQKLILREGKKNKKNETLENLQKEMRLPNLPNIIECFDNSNIQGTNPVASMVRFVDGKPDKKGYRHFNIKTVEGPNDFASMKEIVGRRYKRLLEEQAVLPNLILIDGGKGQLSSACEALQELGLYGKIPIAGIAKRLEEIYYPEDPFPLLISKKSPGLLLLQFIRNEAHRFAITFHRQKRSAGQIKSALTELEGIGPKTTERLLKKFKSVRKIKEATIEELTALVGSKKAALIKSLP